MKPAKQWVKEQRCPEEWASEREVKMIQSDARQELIAIINEALASFKITQNPSDYSADHWSNKAIRLQHNHKMEGKE